MPALTRPWGHAIVPRVNLTLARSEHCSARASPGCGCSSSYFRRRPGMAQTAHAGGEWRREPERILVVRLDTIGDVLLTEPAIGALRERFPRARLDVVAGRGGQAVLAGHPAIDRFVLYDAPWHAAWRGQRVSWTAEPGRCGALCADCAASATIWRWSFARTCATSGSWPRPEPE